MEVLDYVYHNSLTMICERFKTESSSRPQFVVLLEILILNYTLTATDKEGKISVNGLV